MNLRITLELTALAIFFIIVIVLIIQPIHGEFPIGTLVATRNGTEYCDFLKLNMTECNAHYNLTR